jgi:hypothetical protein
MAALLQTSRRAALIPNWMPVQTILGHQHIRNMASPSSENAGDVVMESPASDTEPVASFQPFTKVERIKQLNDIDKVQWVSIYFLSRSNFFRALPRCYTQRDWL